MPEHAADSNFTLREEMLFDDSGSNPFGSAALDHLRAGDALIVCKLDRLRSARPI
jgi:hypothetical protein